MARFHGKVGFIIHTDDQDTGIVREEVVEKTFFGRVLEHSRRWQISDMATNDLKMGNQIAITAYDFAFQHSSAITYCEFMGDLWSVTGIKVRKPEIILTLGGVYNGKRPAVTSGGSEEPGAEGVVQTPAG